MIGYNRVVNADTLKNALQNKNGTIAADLQTLLPKFSSGNALDEPALNPGGSAITLTSLSNQFNIYANAYVGGIIGYYLSMNKCDDIADNYYASGCGAQRGSGPRAHAAGPTQPTAPQRGSPRAAQDLVPQRRWPAAAPAQAARVGAKSRSAASAATNTGKAISPMLPMHVRQV